MLRTLVLALIVALSTPGSVMAALKPEVNVLAFRVACELSGYQCKGLRVPDVIFAPLLGLNGRYVMGDTYILLDETISDKLTFAVAVHEMTHYLQFKNGAWKPDLGSRCANEKEAFEMSNQVLVKLEDTADLVDWSKMKVQYGCP